MFTVLRDALILEFEGRTYTIFGFKEMEMLDTICIIKETERAKQMKTHLYYTFKKAVQPFIDLLKNPEAVLTVGIKPHNIDFIKEMFKEHNIPIKGE